MLSSDLGMQRTYRRRWALAEKQRIVEQTLCEGASVEGVAREHGLHASVISRWRSLYRVGKLIECSHKTAGKPAAAFVPITLEGKNPVIASAVEISLPSGMKLRVERPAIDAAFVCALLAQAQR